MMQGVDQLDQQLNAATSGLNLEESFCIVDRDSAMPPPTAATTLAQQSSPAVVHSAVTSVTTDTSSQQGGSASSIATSHFATTAPSSNSPQLSRSQPAVASTAGQSNAVATPALSTVSTPQRYENVQGAVSAHYTPTPPPTSQTGGPPAASDAARPQGQRMSALRAKPHSELPSALNMTSYPAAAATYSPGMAATSASSVPAAHTAMHTQGIGMGGQYSNAPYTQATSPTGPAYPGAPATGTASMGSPNPYGAASAMPHGYDQQQFSSQGGYSGGPSDGTDNGLWGWMTSATSSVMESASKMVSNPDMLVESAQKLGRNIVDKTKSSVDNVLTTLDPGMTGSGSSSRESANDLSTPGAAHIKAKQVILASTKLPKIEAIKCGFQRCFQTVNVRGFVCPSGIAPQVFGLDACYQGAQQRIQYLRSMHSNEIIGDAVLISVENCIAELLPGCVFDVACIVLLDPSRDIVLQALTQPIPLPSHYVETLRSSNPPNYAQSESGFSVRWPTLLTKEMPGADPNDPHRTMTGMSRYRLLETAAATLARSYELRLQRYTPPFAASAVPEPVSYQPPPPSTATAFYQQQQHQQQQQQAVQPGLHASRPAHPAMQPPPTATTQQSYSQPPLQQPQQQQPVHTALSQHSQQQSAPAGAPLAQVAGHTDTTQMVSNFFQ
eukprot:scpid24010/ scgid20765/ Protein PRRC1; Proline-rich and coiled-coil-containing protein 1